MTYTPVYGPCLKLVVVKAFPYRAEALEEFSNDYTFSPVNIPNTEAEFVAFANALRLQEQQIYISSVKWHRVYGYSSNDPHASHTYLVDWVALGQVQGGSMAAPTDGHAGAGDQAACVEWRSSQKSVTGKPIIFRKYHHMPWISNTAPDDLSAQYLTLLNGYAAYMKTYLGGQYSTKYPTGQIQTAAALPYVTTRTLKKRGKRPNPA